MSLFPIDSFPNAVPVWEREPSSGREDGGTPANVVAMGSPCPTPWAQAMPSQQCVLTAKNLQVRPL